MFLSKVMGKALVSIISLTIGAILWLNGSILILYKNNLVHGRLFYRNVIA
jgi:hypothetical protein